LTIAFYRKPIWKLRSVTCHMDRTVSLPATRHSWTRPTCLNPSKRETGRLLEF